MTRLRAAITLVLLALVASASAADWEGPYYSNSYAGNYLMTNDWIAIGDSWGPGGKLTVIGRGDSSNEFYGETAIYAESMPWDANAVALYARSDFGDAGVFRGRVLVMDSFNSNAYPDAHVAHIQNTSTGTSPGPDVLALRVMSNDATPSGAVNFMTFYRYNISLGAIEGNNSGGVKYKSGGADYAEYLQKLDPSETFHPGDVVGVFDGRISLRTSGAQQIMVISTAPIVVGNHPGGEDREPEDWEEVAFLGQANVRVTGPVRVGDFLLPSGGDDGVAVAVAPAAIGLDRIPLVLGTAWEAFEGEGEGLVNAAIGIDQRTTMAVALQQLHEMVVAKDGEILAIDARIERIAAATEAAETIMVGASH